MDTTKAVGSGTGVPSRAALVVALAASLAGCASMLGTRPEDREVTVSLRVSRAEAVRRTLEAFRDQGYQVAESLTSGSEPMTEPFRHKSGGDEVEAVFRASITGSGGTSRVVLSGTYRPRELAGLVMGKERPVRRAEEGVEGELWARLVNLGVAIRTPP